MRQIKFRAVFFKYIDDTFDYFQYWGIDHPSERINTFPSSSNNGYIKEHNQYTGLKDKNGKEIFEGDIIEINHPHKNRHFKGTVEMIGHGWNCKDFNFTHFDNPYSIFSEGTEYIEITGNKYETT